MIKYILKYILIVFILLIPLHTADAAEVRAFHNINQLPFKQIFALPSLDNSPLNEAGRWRVNVIANLSNTYDISNGPGEQYINDAETFRGSLIASYGLPENWQIGIEVPYIRHSKGFLDDIIYDWHDIFGMPQNGRTGNTNDQMHVSYFAGSSYLIELSDSTVGGLGDIRINAAHSRPWNNRTFIFSSELKFPTGDFDKLTGSGGYDFSVGLTLNDPYSLRKYKITLYGGLAGVFLGDIDGEMADLQNNFVLAGRAGIGWQAMQFMQLKMQLDAQSALYDSDIEQMGDPAFQLVFGGSLFFSEDAYLDISIAEDVNPTTAADVAFQLALVLTY